MSSLQLLMWLRVATVDWMFSPASRTSLCDVKLPAIISCTDDLIVLPDLFSHWLVAFLFLCFGSSLLKDLLTLLVLTRSFAVFWFLFFMSVWDQISHHSGFSFCGAEACITHILLSLFISLTSHISALCERAARWAQPLFCCGNTYWCSHCAFRHFGSFKTG